MKDTLKKPLKTGKENVNNTTNTNNVSLGQDSIYHFLPCFLNQEERQMEG